LTVYKLTATFPREELFGLTSQIRRAASSIPANIAEGCGRGTDGEMHQSLQQAMGSATELDYHFILARDLGLINPQDYDVIHGAVDEIQKMLVAFLARTRTATRARRRAGAVV
jgi:four helix bundle protein